MAKSTRTTNMYRDMKKKHQRLKENKPMGVKFILNETSKNNFVVVSRT